MWMTTVYFPRRVTRYQGLVPFWLGVPGWNGNSMFLHSECQQVGGSPGTEPIFYRAFLSLGEEKWKHSKCCPGWFSRHKKQWAWFFAIVLQVMIRLNKAAFAFSKIQGNHSLGFWENWKWPLARDFCSFLAWWVEKIAQTNVRETETLLPARAHDGSPATPGRWWRSPWWHFLQKSESVCRKPPTKGGLRLRCAVSSQESGWCGWDLHLCAESLRGTSDRLLTTAIRSVQRMREGQRS